MSVVAINRPEQTIDSADCSRLILGDARGSHHQHVRKKPQSIKPSSGENNLQTGVHEGRALAPQNRLTILKPRPLQSRMAWRWLWSTGTDWALVNLNWLLVGAVLIPVCDLFPQVSSFGYAAGAPFSLLGIGVLHAALMTLISHTEGLHNAGSDLRKQGEILAKSTFWASSLLCSAYTLQGHPWTLSGLIVLAGILNLAALWAWRWRIGEHESLANADRQNVLIIGAGDAGQRIAAAMARQPSGSRRVCGFLDDEVELSNTVIGRTADLARIARSEFVDEIILAAPRDSSQTERVLAEARKLRLDIEIVPELFGYEPVSEELEKTGDLPLICVHAERSPTTALCAKRLIDLVIGLTALVALSPMLVIIAALIKLDSRGPVFYSAPRAGRKGQLFRCFKFRTMVHNADELKRDLRHRNQRAGPFFKISCDPRITRVGRYLRRYSLDELPQLWNVVIGEMSLVGPRPHPQDDMAGYEIDHLARLDATPGITGLWQITARRDPSFHRGMELDREYIRRWSLALDARILLKTLRAVVSGSGE